MSKVLSSEDQGEADDGGGSRGLDPKDVQSPAVGKGKLFFST